MPQPPADRIAYARAWTGGSPYYARMGIAVEALDEGRATLRMDARAEHLNADGIVHGGVLPALADAAMGSAARTLAGDAAQLLTAESNLRYLAAVREGAVRAEGRVVKAGHRVVFTEVDITDAQGALVARGGATFIVRRREA